MIRNSTPIIHHCDIGTQKSYSYLVCEKLPVFCVPVEGPFIEGCKVTVYESYVFAIESEPDGCCSFEDVRDTT